MPMHKLTKDQVAEIKILHLNGEKIYALAKRFGVSTTSIRYHIGTSWSVTHKEKNKLYMRDYMKRRYHEEPEFKKRVCDCNVKCARKRRLAEKAIITQPMQVEEVKT